MSIYKLSPIYKNHIWGGSLLREKYAKADAPQPCAESWELSVHKDGESRVDGVPLSTLLRYENLGENAAAFDSFPMLIKLIDARDNLSVQVHPSDAYALKNEGEYGKTEMMYIIEADESAGIYIGFSENFTRAEIERAIVENKLCELLKFYPVSAGDCFFIPSGTVHAICAGCLVCEVEQNSNLTYRLYDYGRKDKDGNPRELHIEKAMRVSNLGAYTPPHLPSGILGISKYFTVSHFRICGERYFPSCKKTFRAVCAVSGTGYLNGNAVSAGETYFIGADEGGFTLSGCIEVLITEVRRYSLHSEHTDSGVRISLTDDLGRVIAEREGEDEVQVRHALLRAAGITDADIYRTES